MNDGVADLPPERVLILSEVDIADCFANQHANELRYVAKWGQWFRYDGRCWREEPTLMAFDLARALCRELTRDSNRKQAEVKSVLSAKTIAAVERIARADRRIAATIDQWDTDPWLLNTPSGAVNLRDGTLSPHCSAHFVTKMTSAGPGGDCPLWHAFLDEFTRGDQELKSFLQRMCGYCLTGDVSEESLFFLFGTGGTGSSHQAQSRMRPTTTWRPRTPSGRSSRRSARLMTPMPLPRSTRYGPPGRHGPTMQGSGWAPSGASGSGSWTRGSSATGKEGRGRGYTGA
jgi:hypothetical protein